MGCLPCCDKTLKVFGSLRMHAFLGGRKVKCTRTYSQKCEVCKFTFERELVGAVAFFCILQLVDSYSSLLIFFSRAALSTRLPLSVD